MRLHSLEATAFGPFADTVRVDFDALSDAGLFLLTGPTGAGKTSVLDAVCFGLYGEVPGERHGARHLRSDQAAPDTEPRVVLRFSVAGRTFRLTRSPAWDRPRRRGEGTRRIQAHVVAEEHRDGAWSALTTRLDEAGLLVTELLGMTVGQFTQVAMLPQGRFQAFLRAGSAERHDVLQRLFRTRRFEDVERWLVERRTAQRRASARGHDEVRALLGRIEEATDVPAPEGWQPDDLDALAALVESGEVATWVAGIGTGLQAAAEAQQERLAAVGSAVQGHRDALDAAQRHVAARLRADRAQHVLDVLGARARQDEVDHQLLAEHRRAEPLLPLLRRVAAATREADAAQEAAEEELRRASRLVPDLTRAHPEGQPVPAALVASLAHARREAVAEARARLPQEQELATAHEEQDALRSRLEQLRAQHAEADDQATRARATAAEQDRRRVTLVTRAATADSDAADAASAVTALAAAAEAAELDEELTATRARLAAATATAQDLRERYLDLREQRITGMAAELATGLAAGCSCPVCGSADHPSPARTASRVSRTDEEQARQEHETADFTRQALAEAVASLLARLAGARERSDGRTAADCRADLEATADRARRSAAAASELRDLDAQRADRDDAQARLLARTAALAVGVQERTRELDQVGRRVVRLDAGLRAWLAAHERDGDDTAHTATGRRVARLLTRLESEVHALTVTVSAIEARDRSAAALEAVRAEAREAATQAGLEGAAAVRAALLPEGRAAEIAERLRRAELERAEATQVLADPDVAAALAAPVPDLDALRSAVDHAERVRDLVVAAHRHLLARHERLTELAGALDRAVAAWEPVRRSHQLTAALASLVEGTSTDNRWRMRLSAYVLSERLRQVVAAANERLVVMTDERFALEQVDEKGVGERRGGLSLRVRDDWTGTRRDPATLSGGETFVVSLALALGLADTVSHEAGGTALDTLFIDEGFGSLDAETLDGVMDTLDQLRDGGRVVGLVSHVAELRTRVPSQLEVTKARSGSTLRPVLDVG